MKTNRRSFFGKLALAIGAIAVGLKSSPMTMTEEDKTNLIIERHWRTYQEMQCKFGFSHNLMMKLDPQFEIQPAHPFKS